MNDTTPEINLIFENMMMKKSGQERMQMGFSMFNMARRQVIASIRNNKPDADEIEIRREIFLRFYEQDFSKEEQKKILDRITMSSCEIEEK
ncbi:MAG: hypothetical protein HZA08_13425 [Nitrospirae bacterium]|nr:hypothetical protein [Nitrospirota bacterium]